MPTTPPPPPPPPLPPTSDRSDSFSSDLSACSSGGSPTNTPDDTLWVVDYDDTLLPTQWLQATAAPDAAALDAKRRAQLNDLETNVMVLLAALQRVGTVVIITNAIERYVELTAAAFLPRVAAWLTRHEVCVVSARGWYEAAFPTDVAAWKLHAFQDVVAAWRVSHAGALPTHVISVGDSLYERWAAHTLAHMHDGHQIASIKTLKLKDAPSCRDLTAQARFLAKHVAGVAALAGDMDMSVVLPQRSCHAAKTAALPATATATAIATAIQATSSTFAPQATQPALRAPLAPPVAV